MISLKRNSKGVLVRANGLRSRESSVYVPKQTEPFRISRSKFIVKARTENGAGPVIIIDGVPEWLGYH